MSVASKEQELAILRLEPLPRRRFKLFPSLSSIALAAMLLSGTFYITDRYRVLQLPLLGLSVTYFFVDFVVRYGRFRTSLSLTTALFYITCFFMVIASVASMDLGLLVRAIGFLVVGIATISIYPRLRGPRALQGIYHTFLATHLPLVLLPMLIDSVTLYRYKGIFHNPNSLGTVMATLFALSWAYFCGLVIIWLRGRRVSGIYLVVIALLVAGTFVGVLITQSRTSLFGALLSSLVVLAVYTPTTRSGTIARRQLVEFLFLLGVVLSGLGIFLLRIKSETGLASAARFVIDKFVTKASTGDVLAGRLAIWGDTIRHARLLGGSRELFSEGLGAHSTYISLLGQYGWIPLLAFLSFTASSFSYVVRYSRARRFWDPYAALPLASITIFAALSLGEGMFQKVSMYLFLLCVGIVVEELPAAHRRRHHSDLTFGLSTNVLK